MSIVTKVALATAIVVAVTADVYLSFGTTLPGQAFGSMSRPVPAARPTTSAIPTIARNARAGAAPAAPIGGPTPERDP
jgi:hypothetical protein